MTAPQVSVLVLSYQQGAYILEAIESVLNQGLDSMEILVVDDASRDETTDIVKSLMKFHPEIRFFGGESNLGSSVNANRGLSLCRGNFISFLAADDLFLPGKLKTQLEEFKNNPSQVMSYHAVEVFGDAPDSHPGLMHGEGEPVMGGPRELISMGGVRNGCSVVIRKSAIPVRGFLEGFEGFADLLFQVEVSLKGDVVKSPGVLGRYRRHGGNMTRRHRNFEREFMDFRFELLATFGHLNEVREGLKDLEACYSSRILRSY